MREITASKLNRNTYTELANLPFVVTKGGKPVAVVSEYDGEGFKEVQYQGKAVVSEAVSEIKGEFEDVPCYFCGSEGEMRVWLPLADGHEETVICEKCRAVNKIPRNKCK